MKRQYLIFIPALIVCVFQSCAISRPADVEIKSASKEKVVKEIIVVVESKRSDVEDSIKRAVSYFPIPVCLALSQGIYVRQDYDHFAYIDEDGVKRYASGHCHSSGKICLRDDAFRPSLVWHEVAHAYAAAHPSLYKHWKELADFKYGKKTHHDFIEYFPAKGVMTSYGATNYKEDLAEFVEELLKHITTGYSAFSRIKDKDDRYLKKLQLLFEYGMIDYWQYSFMQDVIAKTQ